MWSHGPVGAQIGTLILATSIVQLANGFFGTFFSLRVAIENFDATWAGVLLSSYFAGFTAGAFFCGKIIERFGHIRAYAAFAGLVVAATSAMPLLVTPWAWLVLRAVIGVGCAGLFVATESWLNAKAPQSERGRVFSVYMVGTFIALGLGQLLVGRTAIETAAPFNVIVALFAVALFLVTTTRADQPQSVAKASLPFGRLPSLAPVAVAGAALSGFITGSFYALVPAWMQSQGIEIRTIGLIMLTAVLGGLAFQIPVGRISDRFDRRVVLAVLGVALASVAIALALLPHTLPVVLPAVAVICGLMSTLYPVSVAHAHDRMPADQVVAVSGQLILLSGFGSVLGPFIGMNLMRRFEVDGVLYLLAAAALLLSAIAATRALTTTSPLPQERTFDVLAPQAAPLAHDAAHRP
jgi:MFS family permease